MSESKTVRVDPDENVCLAIVDTVSELTATSPLELTPLGRVVDTDAIDALFRPAGANVDLRHDASVSFRYEHCDVTVESDRTVSVRYSSALTEFSSERPAASAADVGSAAGGRGDDDAR